MADRLHRMLRALVDERLAGPNLKTFEIRLLHRMGKCFCLHVAFANRGILGIESTTLVQVADVVYGHEILQICSSCGAPFSAVPDSQSIITYRFEGSSGAVNQIGPFASKSVNCQDEWASTGALTSTHTDRLVGFCDNSPAPLYVYGLPPAFHPELIRGTPLLLLGRRMQSVGSSRAFRHFAGLLMRLAAQNCFVIGLFAL